MRVAQISGLGGHFYGELHMDTPKRRMRKPSEIPPSELRKRLVNAGRHTFIIDGIIEKRLAKARKKQSEGGLKGIRIRRAPAYEPIKAQLTTLNKQIRARLDYLRKTGEATTDPDAVRFLEISLAQVIHTKETLKRHAQLGRVAPAWWQELIKETDHAERTRAYRSMSGRMQDRFAQIQLALSGAGAVEK